MVQLEHMNLNNPTYITGDNHFWFQNNIFDDKQCK